MANKIWTSEDIEKLNDDALRHMAYNLFVFEEKTPEEIAKELDVKAAVVKRWVKDNDWVAQRIKRRVVIEEATEDLRLNRLAQREIEESIQYLRRAKQRVAALENLAQRMLIASSSDVRRISIINADGQEQEITVPNTSPQKLVELASLLEKIHSLYERISRSDEAELENKLRELREHERALRMRAKQAAQDIFGV